MRILFLMVKEHINYDRKDKLSSSQHVPLSTKFPRSFLGEYVHIQRVCQHPVKTTVCVFDKSEIFVF